MVGDLVIERAFQITKYVHHCVPVRGSGVRGEAAEDIHGVCKIWPRSNHEEHEGAENGEVRFVAHKECIFRRKTGMGFDELTPRGQWSALGVAILHSEALQDAFRISFLRN